MGRERLPAVEEVALTRKPDGVHDNAGGDGAEVAEQHSHDEGGRASVTLQAAEANDEVLGQPDEEDRGDPASQNVRAGDGEADGVQVEAGNR